MITIATLLWDPNEKSFDFSRCYDESWVEKLYRGFRRNLTGDMRFVCWTDRERTFAEPIEQVRINQSPIDYRACIEPYAMEGPMILVGLDTMVTGNCDHLADYARTASRLAVPRDPFFPDKVCNGVALIPKGHTYLANIAPVFDNDMDWIRAQDPAVIDDLFPGSVVSFKGHVMDYGAEGASIVYFHGEMKPHELAQVRPPRRLVNLVAWAEEHWR